jgi:hypothetical protein
MPMSPRLLRPRQQSGFDPRRIANLALWLDPTDSTSYTQASGQIEEWRDKSGALRHYDQTTANNRPTLFTSSGDVQTATAAQINGRQAIFFDGVNDLLLGGEAARNIARNVPGLTIFCVLSFTNAPNGRQDIFAIQRAIGSVRFVLNTATSARWSVLVRRETETLLSLTSNNDAITAGVPYVVSVRADFVNLQVSLRANSASQITGTLFGSGGNSEDIDHNRAAIGQQAASLFFSGLLGTVLGYNRALSDLEVQAAERGLAAAWGITL